MRAAAVSFVGRDRESGRLAELLAEGAVVTLTGPGGVGKTTLSRHLIPSLGERFPDGVLWCDLAAVIDDHAVAFAAARALGADSVAPEDALAELPALARGRHALLILDNCEQVVAGAAAAAAAVVSVPGPCVLATSRESLGLAGEQVLALAPLGVPPDDEPATVRASEAARLFADRAAAVRDGFALGEDNAGGVARLCRRVDGLPLALELAAAYARSMSPGEIADRLEERFALLSRAKGATSERQRSLAATLDWSYDLLTEPERLLYERLGVFVSSVRAAEIEGICSGGEIDPGDVLPLLDRLVDRSLATVREVRGQTRYGMLETIRAHARERLAARDATRAMQRRHAEFYAVGADLARLEEVGGRDALDLLRVDDLAEALLATRRCVEHDDDPDLAFRFLVPQWALVHSHGAAEITALAERALDRWGGAGHPLEIRVLGTAACGHFVLGDTVRARTRAAEAIALETADTPALIARRAIALTAYHHTDDLRAAEEALTEVVHAAARMRAQWVSEEMSALRSLVLAGLGNIDSAEALAAAVEADAEGAGLRHMVAWSHCVRGQLVLAWRPERDAAPFFARSLELALALDYPFVVGQSLRQLGVVAALEGDHGAAAD